MKKILGVFVLTVALTGCTTGDKDAKKHICCCDCGCKEGTCKTCAVPDPGISVKIGNHGELHSTANKCESCTCTDECCAECAAAAKANTAKCNKTK